ncbi:unnamed protein product [Urochloa humidicola]
MRRGAVRFLRRPKRHLPLGFDEGGPSRAMKAAAARSVRGRAGRSRPALRAPAAAGSGAVAAPRGSMVEERMATAAAFRRGPRTRSLSRPPRAFSSSPSSRASPCSSLHPLPGGKGGRPQSIATLPPLEIRRRCLHPEIHFFCHGHGLMVELFCHDPPSTCTLPWSNFPSNTIALSSLPHGCHPDYHTPVLTLLPFCI